MLTQKGVKSDDWRQRHHRSIRRIRGNKEDGALIIPPSLAPVWSACDSSVRAQQWSSMR